MSNENQDTDKSRSPPGKNQGGQQDQSNKPGQGGQQNQGQRESGGQQSGGDKSNMNRKDT
jgi:hypothetical protein